MKWPALMRNKHTPNQNGCEHNLQFLSIFVLFKDNTNTQKTAMETNPCWWSKFNSIEDLKDNWNTLIKDESATHWVEFHLAEIDHPKFWNELRFYLFSKMWMCKCLSIDFEIEMWKMGGWSSSQSLSASNLSTPSHLFSIPFQSITSTNSLQIKRLFGNGKEKTLNCKMLIFIV